MVNVEVSIDYMLWTKGKVFVRVGEVGAELAATLRALPEPAIIVGIVMGVFLFFTNIC
jgi:hypoxanthine phosphoribosyltransferase